MYRPSALSWDHKTKRSTGSEQLASWFSGSQAQPIASEECALWPNADVCFFQRTWVSTYEGGQREGVKTKR